MKEKPKWRPFPEARKVSWEYEFEYKEEWDAFIMGKFPDRKPLPCDIPPSPDVIYRHTGWKGWNDWLGTDIKFKDYATTRSFIKSLKLKNKSDWRSFCNNQLPGKNPKPENIYSYLEIAYRNDGWKDWNEWLGTGENKGEKLNNETGDTIIECRCMGRIANCPECDGKGYISILI